MTATLEREIVGDRRPLLLYAVCMKEIKHAGVMGAAPHRVLVTIGPVGRGQTSLVEGESEIARRGLFYVEDVTLVSGRVRVSH